MKKTMLVLALGVCGAVANAKSFVPTYTCAQAQAEVKKTGAAVIYTTPWIYDRYVTDASHCQVDETTSHSPAFIPTHDNPQCNVGYTCVPVPSHSHDTPPAPTRPNRNGR